MRSPRRVVLAAVIGIAAALGTAAPALASPAPATSKAEVIDVATRTGSTTATILVRYTCTGSADQVHTWVSVKQAASLTSDKRLMEEGTGHGGVAAAWSQSHSGAAVCDGKQHYTLFKVDQKEAGYGTLKRGMAYIQFCLFDAHNTEVPVSDMEFAYLL